MTATARIRSWTLSLSALLVAAPLALAQPAGDSLWVSDDVNVTIYNLAMDGSTLSSFHSGSISGVSLSVDPTDGTLWAAKEGSNRIEHYDQAGTKLEWFSGLTYDINSKTPEGVAVDSADGTLWIVDDATGLIYNTQRDGTLIKSFPVASFDPGATSPQDITFDPLTETFWLTDNTSLQIYNVTREGLLVSTFHASGFSSAATNLQGIGVDMVDGSLWITDRDADEIYNVTRNGVLLTTLASSVFGSSNPTGVAHDRAVAATYASLSADVQDGITGGLLSTKAQKHIQHVFKQVDKQLLKGNTSAAGNIVLGMKDYIVGKIGSGDIDEAYGLELAFSAISLSGSYLSG
ncbi:MAG: NHL repeat-containing protein [Planctomycetota bacterium]|jgi:streptogramin lyase